MTDELIVIRNKYTGNEYAYPESKFSELPVICIENGIPGHTGFSRGDLVDMEKYGSALRVGCATIKLDITYTGIHK